MSSIKRKISRAKIRKIATSSKKVTVEGVSAAVREAIVKPK